MTALYSGVEECPLRTVVPEAFKIAEWGVTSRSINIPEVNLHIVSERLKSMTGFGAIILQNVEDHRRTLFENAFQDSELMM